MTVLMLLIMLTVYACYVYYKRQRRMTLLEINNIPGPKPSLIWGNIREYYKLPLIQREEEWIGKYGKIVGYYMGAKPTVLVADPKLAKRIQIVDFNTFTDRSYLRLKQGLKSVNYISDMLTSLRGERWRKVRTALSPTFSASKLKTLTPIMDATINEFITIIDERATAGTQFDIHGMFQSLTTDVIGRTTLGIEANVKNAVNNLLDAAKVHFNQNENQWTFVLNLVTNIIFYPVRRIAEYFGLDGIHTSKAPLFHMVSDAIELRKQGAANRRQDLLQLMLDTTFVASRSIPSISGAECRTRNANVNQTNANDLKGVTVGKGLHRDVILTDNEIKANAVLFYEAGYETTSLSLAFVAHILVNYPDIQEKVRQEVRALLKHEGELGYNVVNNLDFMDCVLNETHRLYPPLISISRECLRDYKYCNFCIPKGTTVQFAIHHLHYSGDYWPDPELFNAMRFSADQKHEIEPNSFQPFGSGPRKCIGMRFALLEIKLCLAKLLLNYKLIPGPNTEFGKLSTKSKVVFQWPTNGVYLKVVKI